MATAARLKTLLPHMQHPVVAAPMAFVSGADLAVAVSQARGLGFLAAGYDLPKLESELHRARALIAPSSPSRNPQAADEGTRPAQLPVGVGLFAWTKPDQARVLLRTVLAHRPCALWLFAPAAPGVEGFRFWVDAINAESSASAPSLPHDRPAIFAQVSSVREALEAAEAGVDVIVAQGADAGGHGAKAAAGLTSLVPEIRDALPPDMPLFAAGGVMDGRGLASVQALGADGAALGTRFLASHEAGVHPAYQRLIVEAHDGGQSTLRTRLFDELRGTTDWPAAYDGRALRNESVREWEAAGGGGGGSSVDELKAAYARAAADRDYGRLVAWAGTGVGLAREVKPAKDIVEDIVRECAQVVQRLHERWTVC